MSNDAGPSSSSSSSGNGASAKHQRLQRAANTVKTFSTQEAKPTDLGDYLNASVNQPYKLFLSAGWSSLRKVRTLTIPDAVIQASTSAQSYAAQGLFPDIERAWIIIDSQLYLWNYLEGSSSAFESYVHPSDIIQSVSLIKPKSGVFIDSIKHLLVIGTQSSVTLLGLALETTPPPASQKELKLYQTDFTLQTAAVVMQEFVSTPDGSKVFCRGSDTCLYELSYQAKEGWFSSKCSLKNLTGGGVKNLLPGWAGGSAKESLDSIVFDSSRSLLYALHSKRSISVYSVSSTPGTPPTLVATVKDIHRTASLISPNNASLFRQDEFAIISLQPIHSQESRNITLLATTNKGVRLFFTNQRSGFRSFTMPASSLGSGTALELLYVRPPPSSGLSPKALPSTSIADSLQDSADHPPSQPPIQHLSHAIYKDGIFLTAGAYAYERGLDNLLCINRPVQSGSPSNTAVSAGQQSTSSTALVQVPSASSATAPEDAAEEATDLLISGATWALAEVPRATASATSPLIRQTTSLPRTFLALTSTGLTILVENRPIDLLRELLERSGVTAGPGNVETMGLVEIFKRHGQSQACSMAMAIAARNSYLRPPVEALLSVNALDQPNVFTPQATSPEALLNATRIFFGHGGSPRYEPPLYPHQPLSEGRVILSGRHDGFGIYASRLLVTIWDRKLKDVGSAVGKQSTATAAAKDLEDLRGFLSAHAEALGLGGKAGSDGSGGEGEALAIRAEQDSVRSLSALLDRCLEALSFVVLIGDLGWDRISSKLSDGVRSKVDSMGLGDLILEAPASGSADASTSSNGSGSEPQTPSRALVEALIDVHSTSSAAGMDMIAELLQTRCSSFCDANDVRVYKALERVRQARDLPLGGRREEALRESETLMMKASYRLHFERLEEVVKLWQEMDWIEAAIQLPLKCAAEWDNNGFAQSYRRDGLPEGDSLRRPVYERSMKCYGLVLRTLKTLDEKVDSAKQGNAAELHRLQAVRSAAYASAERSQDPLLHEALYDFLLESGRKEQLLDVRTPFLEAYLQQEPLTLEKLEMLWQCYTRRGEGPSAARVLVGLAESTELNLTLFQRLEYLTLASNNAKSSTIGGYSALDQSGFASVAFVADIEEKLEVAQVQVEVYRAVGEVSELEDDKKDSLLMELDSALLDISTLYRDFADPLQLYDVKILIYTVSDFRDAELIDSTWEFILDRAHEEGIKLLSSARAHERVSAVVIELGKRFMSCEFACPIDVLARNLEQYALVQGEEQKIPSGWAVQTLLSASAPSEAVFDAVDGLFQSKVEPWQTKSALIFLLGDLLYLVDSWLNQYLSTSLSRQGLSNGRASLRSSLFGGSTTTTLSSSTSSAGAGAAAAALSYFPAKRIDDALDGYLSTLNAYAGHARSGTGGDGGVVGGADAKRAREVISGIKVVQDRLRSVF